jgi:hypothetical protein
LNPGFGANLLWHAALGYQVHSNGALSFEESFLVLPFVLHGETRESLPRSSRTSLAVWLNDFPLSRNRVASRAQLLVPFTKEAITFGGMHGFINIDSTGLHANIAWRRAVSKSVRVATPEVKSCLKRAEFIGQWFATTGNSATVLALIGVRP